MSTADKEKKLERVVEILRKHDIRIAIEGFGCSDCQSPVLSFEYQGEMIIEEEEHCGIDMLLDLPVS